ncbi:MAG: prepilin-type N-terminal cleavage/methylation domain-containing protein [Defluviitaleaceae bacterium]|nr:prepilin-type N-terminal cleavage/methylation domain-containing protein [Defluviitaleaceae bacterium]
MSAAARSLEAGSSFPARKKARQARIGHRRHVSAAARSLEAGSSFLARKKSGFTLLELVIALSLWMILSASVFFVWQHAANAGADMLGQQYAFENARITMDVLLVNLQLARRVEIVQDGEILRTLFVWQYSLADPYQIHFIAPSAIVTIGQRLGGNTFATNIASVRLEYLHESRVRVTVVSTCDEAIELVGSVCVRGKYVEVR